MYQHNLNLRSIVVAELENNIEKPYFIQKTSEI